MFYFLGDGFMDVIIHSLCVNLRSCALWLMYVCCTSVKRFKIKAWSFPSSLGIYFEKSRASPLLCLLLQNIISIFGFWEFPRDLDLKHSWFAFGWHCWLCCQILPTRKTTHLRETFAWFWISGQSTLSDFSKCSVNVCWMNARESLPRMSYYYSHATTVSCIEKTLKHIYWLYKNEFWKHEYSLNYMMPHWKINSEFFWIIQWMLTVF